jgi:hypothetical protein
MEGRLSHMCAGNQERNIFEIKRDDLNKKILVLNLGDNWAKIIMNDLEGWVPQECIQMNQFKEYWGRISAEAVEEKLDLAPEKSCAIYMKMANFYMAIKIGNGFNHLKLYRRDGGNYFHFQRIGYKSLNALAGSVLVKNGDTDFYQLTENLVSSSSSQKELFQKNTNEGASNNYDNISKLSITDSLSSKNSQEIQTVKKNEEEVKKMLVAERDDNIWPVMGSGPGLAARRPGGGPAGGGRGEEAEKVSSVPQAGPHQESVPNEEWR